MEYPAVTLATLAGGALGELFEAELERALANLADPNTDPKAARKITIAITIRGNEDRDLADVRAAVSSKLAHVREVGTRLFIGRRGGRLVAVEHDPKQAGLFDPADAGPRAVVAPGKWGGE